MPTFPHLDRDIQTDVLIIGGGIAGVLCARKLEQSGVDYALIEADRICSGISRNTTAKITTQHGLIYDKLIREFGPETAKLYWQANDEVLREYRSLASTINCDFTTKDSYLYSTDSAVKLEKEMKALDRLGIPAEFVDDIKLPFSVVGAIRFGNQAQFHPLKFLSHISKELHIYEHTPARQFLGNRVATDRGSITASKIIVATHFPILNKHGSFFIKMFQQRSYVVGLENAGDVEGMYLDVSEGGLSFRNHANLLLLGGKGNRTGKPAGGWRELEQCAKTLYPESKVTYRWATQDCMTLDGIPYIGQYSKHTPDLYVATGFNKWGMTSAMVAANILADLVQEKENPYAEIFSPSRTMIRPQFFVNAWESATNLLTFTKPRCPHLGCALKWNAQEHSWDCPCHGSRFTKGGKLLDNPATGDLPDSRSS